MRKLYKFAIVGLLIILLTIDLATGCKNRGEQKREQSNVASEAQAEKISTEEKSSPGETEVIAYYFYTNFRCQSCYTIEKYTKETIESNFEDELVSGKLVFKAVNVEEKENEHFINDYQLYTKSVVLSLIKDGKEVRFKNLKEVWELLRNKDRFYKYIKEETQKFLEEIKTEKEQ
jgi:hypothetical protein